MTPSGLRKRRRADLQVNQASFVTKKPDLIRNDEVHLLWEVDMAGESLDEDHSVLKAIRPVDAPSQLDHSSHLNCVDPSSARQASIPSIPVPEPRSRTTSPGVNTSLIACRKAKTRGRQIDSHDAHL